MKIFANDGHVHSESIESMVAQSAPADEGMLKFIAIGGAVLFVALVIALLVAKRG